MVSKKNLFYLLLLTIYSLKSVHGQDNYTLKECIYRGIEKNISIKNSLIELKLSEADRLSVVGDFLPNINISANNSWSSGLTQDITTGLFADQILQSANGSLNIGVDLYNGLSNIKNLQRANLIKQSNTLQTEKIKEDISLLIVNSYLQILFNNENVNIQNRQLNVAEEELNIAREKYISGIISKGDLLEIEANLAKKEENLITAKNNLILSKISLGQILLIDDISNFDINYDEFELPNSIILTKDPQEIFKTALNEISEVKIAEKNLQIAKKNKELAYTMIQPSINAFYSYNSRVLFENSESIKTQFDENIGKTYGLQLSIPIFNNLNTQTSIKKSKLNIIKSENLLQQAKLDLENLIYQSLKNAKGASKTFEASVKTFQARETAYDYAKERFKNGSINTLDFLQIQQQYENAQSELIKSKYDYIFKIKVLEFYCGIEL
jgi:outer membrane protein